jgi:hypothetical protein
MNYLFLFDKGYISLLPLLEFEQYVWDIHKEVVLWNTDSVFPNNHIIGYVDKDISEIGEYYNFLINKDESLKSSQVNNTQSH